MPHLGHIIVLMIVEAMAGVLTGAFIGFLTISSLTGCRRDAYWRVASVDSVWADAHFVCEIDPGEPENERSFVAFEFIQAVPQSFWLKDFAAKNI